MLLLTLLACGVTVSSECVPAGSTPLTDEESSPGGFSASEVLAFTAGTHETVGTYEDGVTVGAIVEVTRAAGDATWEESDEVETRTPNGTLWGESHLSMEILCLDVLSVPTAIVVRTQDAVVDLAEAGALTATGLDDVDIDLELSADEMEGVPPVDGAEGGFVQAHFESDLGMTGGRLGWNGTDEDSSWARYILEW